MVVGKNLDLIVLDESKDVLLEVCSWHFGRHLRKDISMVAPLC
jgi:hypothetical protein